MAKQETKATSTQGDDIVKTPEVKKEDKKEETKKRWQPKDAEFKVLTKFLSDPTIIAQADHVLLNKKDNLTFQLMIEDMKDFLKS